MRCTPAVVEAATATATARHVAEVCVARRSIEPLGERCRRPLRPASRTLRAPDPSYGADLGMGVAWGLGWGLDDEWFARRSGLITNAEVRAVALEKLVLPAGRRALGRRHRQKLGRPSSARLAPGLRVIVVERQADDCERMRAKAGVRV